MITQIFFIALIAGLILIGAEIFIPGAVLGILGALMLLVAIVTAFPAFPTAGPFVAGGVVLLVGLAFYLWIRIFPHTGMFRRMSVTNDLKTWKAIEPGLDALLGKSGVAVSPLRPAGYVQIDGRRVDVVTRGEMIAKDRPIHVVAVEGNRVVVAETP